MFGKKLGNRVDPSITPHGSPQMTPCGTPQRSPQRTPRGSLSRIPRKINSRTPGGSPYTTYTITGTTSITSQQTPLRTTPNLEITITSPGNTSQNSGYVLYSYLN